MMIFSARLPFMSSSWYFPMFFQYVPWFSNFVHDFPIVSMIFPWFPYIFPCLHVQFPLLTSSPPRPTSCSPTWWLSPRPSEPTPPADASMERGSCPLGAGSEGQDGVHKIWLVVWNIWIIFPMYLEESSQLTNFFQRGWNHQPVVFTCFFTGVEKGSTWTSPNS